MERFLLPERRHVERVTRLKFERKHVEDDLVDYVERVLKSERKHVEDDDLVDSVERGLKSERKHVEDDDLEDDDLVDSDERELKSERKHVEDDDLVDSVERGLKSERKHVEDDDLVDSVGLKLELKNVEDDHVDTVDRGTPLKSSADLTYKKPNRYSRKKQFVAERKKQFRADMPAQRKRKMEIKTAEAAFHRRTRHLSEYDVIHPPAILQLVGGIRPYTIRDSNRLRLAGYCEIALKVFNERNNQDPKFDFDGLVKSTRRIPGLYFITFKAKKQDDASPTIFQANVWKEINGPIDVICCAIKKD